MGTVARVQRSTTFFLDRSQPHKWMPSEVSGRVPPPPGEASKRLGWEVNFDWLFECGKQPPANTQKAMEFRRNVAPLRLGGWLGFLGVEEIPPPGGGDPANQHLFPSR